MIEIIYTKVLFFFCIILTFQGSLSVLQMIFGWGSIQQVKSNEPPKENEKEKNFFTIIVPAKNEEKVIASTLRGLILQTYSDKFWEILVSVSLNDSKTIQEVNDVIKAFPNKNIRLIAFETGPMKKSHFLNIALPYAKGDYVVVFDAEDEVNPMLLSYINTLIIREGSAVYQTGVSLVNWKSNWFGIHAALEYYFWFHSRLQWFANIGIVPLGGVGIFIPKETITKIGGWDENCLTEDAKLGIDCALNEIPLRIFSQEKYTTKEEIPISLRGFLKQRTRWIQGFIQIIFSRKWIKLPFDKQFYFLSLFLFPFFQILFYSWLVVSLILSYKLPVWIVIFSFVPLALLLFQIVIQLIGIVEMLAERKQIKYIPLALTIFTLTYVFYQIIMVFATLRALLRGIGGNFTWEKTDHINVHRIKTQTI